MAPRYVLSDYGSLYGTHLGLQICTSDKWRQRFRNVGQDKCVARAGLWSKESARVRHSFMFHYRLLLLWAGLSARLDCRNLPKLAEICRKLS
jgi:hypothetical protein